MSYSETETDGSEILFLDSGCSNHMTGYRHFFEELDETHKLKVKIGDNKFIQVEMKGTVAIATNKSGMRYHYNVYYIPELLKNILSIGQLMKSEYSVVLFDENFCTIKERTTNQSTAEVKMATNKLFLFEISGVKVQW